MRLRLPALLGLGGLVLAGTLTGASAPAAAAPVSALGPFVRTLNFLPGLDKATSLGDAPSSFPLTVGISLQTTDPTAEKAAYDAEYDPKSPTFHHFLSVDQFDALYATPVAHTKAAESWLKSGGLKIATVASAGDYITATGTTSQVATLMHTSFGRYTIGGHEFVANRIGPGIPSSIGIDDVAGLNTLQQVYSTQQQMAQLPHKRADAVKAASASYTGELDPQDLWGAYDLPASDEGQGEIAGVFGDGYFNTVSSDLRYFEAQHDLPQVPIKDVLGDGGKLADYKDNTGTVEWTLDTDALTGMAPKLSQLDLYFANSPLDANFAANFMTWAGQKTGAPNEMNASFGECEEDPTSSVVTGSPLTTTVYGVGVGNQLQLLGDKALEQAAMEGRTLFVAAGDTSGSCPVVILPVIGAGNGVVPQPDNEAGYPVSSAYVTGVGGTVVTTNGTTATGTTSVHRVNETSWVYGGGGTAYTVPEPAWQKPVAAVDLPCVEAGVPSPTQICRGAPDVAAMSGAGLPDGEIDGDNSYGMTFDYIDFGEGGTSLSSPLTVGIWARIQAAAPRNASGTYNLGFASPTIYQDAITSTGAYTANYAKDFYDVTANDLPTGATGNVTYMDAKGWDYVSGFGVIDGAHFIRDVDHNAALTPTHATAQVAQDLVKSCSVTSTSGVGNASDVMASVTYPFTNDSHQDITKAVLQDSTDGKSLLVTMKGPALAPTNPTDATGGSLYVELWRYGSKVYGAGAAVSETGAITYETVSPNANLGYSVTHTLTTGSFGDNTLSVTVPLADVGSPPSGALLVNPLAVTEVPGSVFASFAIDAASPAAPGAELLVGHCVSKLVKGRTTPVIEPIAITKAVGKGSLASTGLDERLGAVALLLMGLAVAGTRLRRTA